jgi:hypothetical protein
MQDSAMHGITVSLSKAGAAHIASEIWVKVVGFLLWLPVLAPVAHCGRVQERSRAIEDLKFVISGVDYR